MHATRINGIYGPVLDETLNGQAVFRKAGDSDTWLYFGKDKYWTIGSAENKQENNKEGFAFAIGGIPHELKQWKTFERFEWKVRSGVHVRTANNLVWDFSMVLINCCVSSFWSV